MRYLWVVLFLLVPIGGTALFIVAAASENAWLPANISTIGHDIDHLFYVILGITGFFFVATEVLLVYAMLTSRGKESGKATYTHGNNYLEFAWTAMTAAILLFVALYQVPAWSASTYRSHKPNKEPTALVTGTQFLWQIRYPLAGKKLDSRNPNLRESFELINELHVPAGEDVVLDLTTRDVLHSFWLPNLRVKQDTLPGHIIPVWFKIDPKRLDPKAPGVTYDGNNRRYEYAWYCAELCGWGHYRMRGKLYVYETKEAYDKWLNETSEQFNKGEEKDSP